MKTGEVARSVPLSSICLLWLLGIGGVALAQEEEELEVELFFAPAETITSASRHAQPLVESPSAITVLTREDIQASGARNLPEILRLVPNLDVCASKPLWYSVGVRGRTTEAADTMLLLVDGRDVTMEFFGFPLWAAYPTFVDEVERIEIIRGPGSALYGANAYAGIVQLFTREPGTGPRASFSIRGGEHGATEVNLHGNQRLGPAVIAASAGAFRENLWTSRDKTGREQVRGKLSGKVDLGPKSRLFSEAGVSYLKGLLQADLGEVQLDNALDTYVRVRLDRGDSVIQAVYHRLDFDIDLGVKLVEKDLDLTLASVPKFTASTDKASLQAQQALETFHNRLVFGADYVFNHYYGEMVIPTDQYEHRIGLFAQDEVELHEILNELWAVSIPPLIMTAGLRFDYNTITNPELSPRASLVFAPSEAHSLRLGYAHAFLKPTFLESSLKIRLQDPIDPFLHALTLANPHLENQTIDSLELGYSGSFLDGWLLLRLDLAYNWYRKQIWFVFDPSQMKYTQIGSVRVPDLTQQTLTFSNDPTGQQGYDLELQTILRPTDGSRLFFQAGYRRIFNSQTGALSAREPVWHLGAGVDLKSQRGLTASVRAFYTDSYERDLADPQTVLEPSLPVRIPAAFLLNARLAWVLVEQPFDLIAGVEGFNLLGNRFRELAGLTLQNRPDYGAERLARRIVFFLSGELW